MKTRYLILAALLILSGSVMLVISQQAGAPAAPVQPNANGPLILAIDRSTWDIYDPYNRGLDLAPVNTPEARLGRWKMILGFEFRDEYARQFPLTQEEQAEAQAAAFAIAHPMTLQEFRNQPRSPEEQRALDQSLESFLHPASANAADGAQN